MNKHEITIPRGVLKLRKIHSVTSFKTINALAPINASVVKKYVNDALLARILASRVCGVFELVSGVGSFFFNRLALQYIAVYKLMGKNVPTTRQIQTMMLARMVCT